MDDWSKDISTASEPTNLESAVSDEAARKRAREFDDALHASLECRAQTEQAQALVNTVAHLVIEHELETGGRKGQSCAVVTPNCLFVELKTDLASHYFSDGDARKFGACRYRPTGMPAFVMTQRMSWNGRRMGQSCKSLPNIKM